MNTRMQKSIVLTVGIICFAATAQEPPVLVSVEKIWDAGDHNAFTDLTRFQDSWYCVFREADGHVKGDGRIRVITSADGLSWSSCALLEEAAIDLRDPKICITPDRRLMITMGGSVYHEGKLQGRRPRVAFSENGAEWTAPAPVCREGDWLWRTTWHGDTAYGVAYSGPVEEAEEWTLTLMSSMDGENWQPVTVMEVPGRPNETTLRVQPDGLMVALIRREGGNRNAWLGESRPPYTEWNYRELQEPMGGPNFILLPDGRRLAAGRRYVPEVKTFLGPLTTDTYTPALELPSGGDTSYPGLVWHDGLLWVSYYASHEGKSCIYLAKVHI